MTPQQKEALESLVGRSLTQVEIDDIDVHLPNRNDVEIANILSVGRIQVRPTEVGNGLVLATVGLQVGNVLLDVLNTAPDFRYVKPLLEQGRLDITTPLARMALDGLVGVVEGFEQSHANALKALAEYPDPIQYNEVSNKLNVAEGRVML